MCLALYIGTDQPLATSLWSERQRQFYLAELATKDEPARQHFSKPYVYYAGSHLQCSCGFFHNCMVHTDDPEMMRQYEESQQSARALVSTLEQVLDHSDTIEVFLTWEGNQALAPSRHLMLTPSDLLSPLQPYSDDTDPEVKLAISAINEQDFIILRKGKEGL
jgi:hypothetical protein